MASGLMFDVWASETKMTGGKFQNHVSHFVLTDWDAINQESLDHARRGRGCKTRATRWKVNIGSPRSHSNTKSRPVLIVTFSAFKRIHGCLEFSRDRDGAGCVKFRQDFTTSPGETPVERPLLEIQLRKFSKCRQWEFRRAMRVERFTQECNALKSIAFRVIITQSCAQAFLDAAVYHQTH